MPADARLPRTRVRDAGGWYAWANANAHPPGRARRGGTLRDDSPAVGRRAGGAGVPALRRADDARTRSTGRAEAPHALPVSSAGGPTQLQA